MKLQLYTPENSLAVRAGEPRISFSDDGSIRVSADAMKLPLLAKAKAVVIAKDEEDGQYYLVPSEETQGFTLRENDKRSTSKLINSKRICCEIRKDYKLPLKQTNSLLLSSSEVEADGGIAMYPILNSEK